MVRRATCRTHALRVSRPHDESHYYEPDLDECATRRWGPRQQRDQQQGRVLMTDGGTFNGQHRRRGWASRRWRGSTTRRNTNLLTSASDYADLYNALQQACTNLIGTAGITSANCAQVKNAALAVEMNQDPPERASPGGARLPGRRRRQSTSSTTTSRTPPAATGSSITGSGTEPMVLPAARHGYRYATSGTHNLWGYDQGRYRRLFDRGWRSAVALPPRVPALQPRHGFDDDSSTPTTAA